VTTSTEVKLPGVERYGAGYRIRVRFPRHLVPKGTYIETGLTTPAAAFVRRQELEQMRAAGISPLTATPAGRTLGQAAANVLKHKRLAGRTGALRPRGVEHWERSLKPWLSGDHSEHAETPLSLFTRQTVEPWILDRALVAATAARNELQALKTVIRAEPTADQTILAIPAIDVEPRQRKALALDELDLLAACAPAYARRMLMLKGTAGFRIGELFTLTDDRLDLHGADGDVPAHGSALVTAALAKEGLPKRVALDADQVLLVREQLLARAPGTRLVFPTATGKPWRYGQFHKLVWSKACSRAADIWRDERGFDDDAETPFCDLTPHDLRATAATLMREVGFSREEAADRLGHVDSGELLDKVYDQGDRGARARRAIAAKTPHGLRHALDEQAEQAARPSTRSTATATLGLVEPS
jgi:integrase